MGETAENSGERYLKVCVADAGRWAFWCKMTPTVKRNRDHTYTLCFSNWPAPPMRGYHEVTANTLDEAMDLAMGVHELTEEDDA